MRHLLGVSLFRAVGLKHLPGSQWCWVRGWRSWRGWGLEELGGWGLEVLGEELGG